MLNNAVTAQYTHTLTVTAAGDYRCTVSNNKPSSDSATITLGSMFSTHFPINKITNCQLNWRYLLCTYHGGFLSAGASPPSGVTTEQDGPTSIIVSWTPPSPPGDTSGYRIDYTRAGGSSVSVEVDGGNTNSRTLMGLTNGETYTISVAGTSSTSSTVLPSPPESAGDVALGILQVSLKTHYFVILSQFHQLQYWMTLQ